MSTTRIVGSREGLVAKIEELEAALRSMWMLAAIAHNGDPWYAEHAGVDADAIFEQAREALAEEAG